MQADLYLTHRWPDLSRLPMGGLLCALALLLGVVLAWAQAPKSPSAGISLEGAAAATAGARPETPAPVAETPIREGTEVTDQAGRFTLTGDRAVFVTSDGRRRWCGLENLSLERVMRTVADTPETLEWTVSGTITEYRGANYLLIRRATLRSRTPLRAETPAATPKAGR